VRAIPVLLILKNTPSTTITDESAWAARNGLLVESTLFIVWAMNGTRLMDWSFGFANRTVSASFRDHDMHQRVLMHFSAIGM